MKTPSTSLFALAFGLAAVAARADLPQQSAGLDPLLENAATSKPSVSCPASGDAGMSHVTTAKGEFFVDLDAKPQRVRTPESGWVSTQETGNQIVIQYRAACPPPVMAFSAMGLVSASVPMGMNPAGGALTPSSLGFNMNAAPGGATGGPSTPGFTPNTRMSAPPPVPGAGPTVANDNGSLNLKTLSSTAANSVGQDLAGSLGRNIGSTMRDLLSGGDQGGAAPRGGHLGTTVASAEVPVAGGNGALVQDVGSIQLTHNSTRRAQDRMKKAENDTFNSGAVTPNGQAPDPNAGNFDPHPMQQTWNHTND